MQPLEILDFVNQAKDVSDGFCVAVTQNNTSSFYGFFEIFDDSAELMKTNKWRFIPINYCHEYFYDKRNRRTINPDFSIIIDGSTITNLEVIRNFSRAS